MRGSILLLLLGRSTGAPSKDVQDLCRDEARSTTTVRENVIVAIRGGGFRRRPGQAMIHPCCPSRLEHDFEKFPEEAEWNG